MSTIKPRSNHDKLPVPAYIKTKHAYSVSSFTREELVSQQLDILPKDVWTHKDWKFLNPVSKSGAYELEMFRRLMKGLAREIPNVNARRAWIVGEMIWSFCPTYATCMICRRNYVGKASGNVKGYAEVKSHVYQVDYLNKSEVAMATGDKVKFDVIVGNPPYQQKDGGYGASAKALYPAFIAKAVEMNPAYLSMVIPAKWLSGDGKGTDELLSMMIGCRKVSTIITTNDSRDWFPDVDLKGGAMYFLYDGSRNNPNTVINGIEQDLSDTDVIVIDTKALDIKNKVTAKTSKFFDAVMYGSNLYNVNTNHSVWEPCEGDTYVCHCSGKGEGGRGLGKNVKYISRSLVIKNIDTIDKWKLCIATASGKGKDGTNPAFIAVPGAITTQSYYVLATFLIRR